MRLSSRVSHLKSSAIMDIAATANDLKAKGVDVVSLAAGEPDFNTPEPIQRAATEAMAKGITKYTPSAGFPQLREVLADKITNENGFQVHPDEIVITCGAKHAIFMALQCLLEPGDVVLMPTPAWVSYTPMIELAGATIFPLPLFEEDHYRVNVDRWKGLAIPPTAKGIIINSPNNPTGMVYNQDDLKRFAAWALSRNLWIMSDEIYEKMIYDGETHVSTASLGPEVKANTITINGFSKSYCMTGWRLGWAIGDKELIKKMSAYQSQSNSHVTSFVQWAGLTAAKSPESTVENMRQTFEKRRNYCMERLNALSEYLTYTPPKGAFYFFVNFSKFLTPKKMSDFELCKALLDRHHVALVPGSSFGKEKSIRMSYATSDENLKKAFDRIETFLKS